MDLLNKLYTQVSEFFLGMSNARKAAVGLTSACIFAAGIMMFYWASDKSFNTLMTNLNPEDATQIIGILRDRKIPFNVDQSGRNIYVPPEHVDQVRLELATLGLPQSGTVGYEVFDKQSLGTTSFVQKINEKRAREGELMRTISSIKGVKRSRVHLAIPSKSTFIEDQKKPTGSVVLDLEPGTILHEKQIFGIGNLVARAVEGMDVSDVVIVDAMGKILSKNNTDPLAQATATQLEFRQKVEQEMERKIEEMLFRVVGDGRVVARVNADLDFSQTTETQTQYDADGAAVVSVQKDQTSAEGTRPGPMGLAGARTNLPEQPAQPVPMTRNDTKRNNEVTNYKVPETIRQVMKPSGSVRKLSVAIVVDGQKVKTTDANGVVTTKIEPWPAEKLQEFESLVAGALGVDKKRGDSLEIKQMNFTSEDFEEAQKQVADAEKKNYIRHLILYAVIGMTIVMFFLLVVRPFIKWITENTVDSVENFLPQTIEELEKIQKNASVPGLEDAIPEIQDRIDPEKVEGEMLKEKIIAMVDANPQKAAIILRDWLHGESAPKNKDKEEAS